MCVCVHACKSVCAGERYCNSQVEALECWTEFPLSVGVKPAVMFLLNILTVADTSVNTIDHESENEVKASVKASSLFFQ